MIACSRMYNVAPAARAAWDRVFAHVAEVSGVPLEIVAHPAPSPLEELWTRPDLGAAFMCGLPFATADPRPVPLAVPIPTPAHYGGGAVYFSRLAVRRDSEFETVEDAFGGRVAWTVENSYSGYVALLHHLRRFRMPDRPTLFREAVGPLVTPTAAIEAVIEGTRRFSAGRRLRMGSAGPSRAGADRRSPHRRQDRPGPLPAHRGESRYRSGNGTATRRGFQVHGQ